MKMKVTYVWCHIVNLVISTLFFYFFPPQNLVKLCYYNAELADKITIFQMWQIIYSQLVFFFFFQWRICMQNQLIFLFVFKSLQQVLAKILNLSKDRVWQNAPKYVKKINGKLNLRINKFSIWNMKNIWSNVLLFGQFI